MRRKSIKCHSKCIELLILLLMIAFFNSTVVSCFKYKIRNEELTAPHMLCFSGLPSSNSINTRNNDKKHRSYSLSANPCPNMDSKADLESYEAVVVDDAGYIQVQLTDIVMQSSSTTSTRMHPNHRLQLYLISLDDLIEQFDDNNNNNTKIRNHPCCFQMEQNAPEYCSSTTHSKTSSSTVFLHDYRIQAPRIAGPTGSVSPPISTVTNATSAFLNLETSTTTTFNKQNQVVDFVARLKPQRRGRHVVVLSNCASDIIIINNNSRSDTVQTKRRNTTTTTRIVEPVTAFIRDVDVHFVFRFGELPLSLMGIIPFYGIIASCYALLSITWIVRSNNSQCRYWATLASNICTCFVQNNYYFSKCYASNSRRTLRRSTSSPNSSTGSATPLLGLQKAIRSVVFAQTLFCSIAFAYYLHLNWIADSVDINVLYSGTAAALVHVWDPFSLVLAICHFGTILLAQCVVTLVTDGTWLIQHNIRTHTKRVLKILILLWMFYFALYAVMSTKQRIISFTILLTFWIGCLLYNIHSSLKHLKAVMIGQSNEQILAVGGAILAKRSIYRKMYAIVLLYPIIFVTSFIWTSCVRRSMI